MAFKTFAPSVLTSSDVNTFLMRQAVIACTSSTRPASPSEGMTIYETDTDLALIYTGTAWQPIVNVGDWTAYTPTLQSFDSGTDWVIGNGTIVGRYSKIGRFISVFFTITFGSTSTFGTKTLGLSLPVNSLGSSYAPASGDAFAYDISVGTAYQLSAHQRFDGTSMIFGAYAASGTFASFDAVNSTEPTTWQSGDVLTGYLYYRSAS
jgi:hypothetical protein